MKCIKLLEYILFMQMLNINNNKVMLGSERQENIRNLEHLIKKNVLIYCRWTNKYNISLNRISCVLDININTLKYWKKQWKKERCIVKPKGRKSYKIDKDQLFYICFFLYHVGPSVGVPTLESVFKDVPRNLLYYIKYKYQLHYKKNKDLKHVLNWKEPGTVWTMDFTQAPCKIDNKHKYILMIRDLSSKKILKALPCSNTTSTVVINALKTLFAWYGSPLVIKADNGSAFISKYLKKFLKVNNVEILYSPPYTPSYNGAVEAGMASIKTKIHYITCKKGRPGYWSSEDVEEARLQANNLTRPKGKNSATPSQLWYNRNRVSKNLRTEFKDKLETQLNIELAEYGFKSMDSTNKNERRKITRKAITSALVKTGLLEYKIGLFSPPIFKCFRVNIR